MQENQVHIWAVGGCGGEIGSAFEGEVAKGLHSMTYVDTSRANLRDSTLGDDHIYIFKDAAGRELDGSGKKRDENAELIRKSQVLSISIRQVNLISWSLV